MSKDKIVIRGARSNNLKNIDLELPRGKFIIMTGLSGSGKSSLAFDTIYAEGQRRYVESLSAYARQFLGGVEKPDVDSIDGLSPAIAIDQKSTQNNPRSTVGTVTEIYDYLRLLYGRVGIPYCPTHHEPIEAQSIKSMVNKVMELADGTKLQVLAPIVKEKKGTHKDRLDQLRKDGYIRVRINGVIKTLDEPIELEKNNRYTIEAVIDRIVKKEDSQSRLYDSIETALKLSDGLVVIDANGEDLLFSAKYACRHCGFSIPNLEPRLFSFNAPLGACPTCNGLGFTTEVDTDLLMPDKELSIRKGGIVYLKNIVESENIEWQMFEVLFNHYQIDLDKPLKSMTKKEMDIILNGSKEPIQYSIESRSGNTFKKTDYIEGVKTLIERRYSETTSNMMRDWYGGFMSEQVCHTCHGQRLNEHALAVKIGTLNISQVTALSIEDAMSFFEQLELTPTHQEIATLVLKEIKERLSFLLNVGLDYLTLSRSAGTLSGGEAQRIRLATQIGSKLTEVLYVLDEPSIGLHQRDNERLIHALLQMRDLGNTLIVVEHDEDTMKASDYIVDIGPGAGELGGNIVVAGTIDEIMACEESITGQYLSGKKSIPVPKQRRKGNGLTLEIKKAEANNLKGINVKIPLGKLVVVTGVSGGGKSSLINEILLKGLASKLYKSKDKPGKHQAILGVENIDKIVDVSQSPIGRTPRSNPATYTGVFDDIRDLFTQTKEAKMRGYDKGRFSFNVKGGRCEVCQGDGVRRISMHFLPDVYVPCEECEGKRYNQETLQVTYRDANIYDVLEMTVTHANEFFQNLPKIKRKLQILEDVGLGYIKLGQSATTLSGGEAQRVKLAAELQKRPTGKTLYILDEPTTGLHMDDVARLIEVIEKIVDQGDSVVIIEHNLDVIKVADYIIDLGPEGGDKGGMVVATGTPEQIVKVEQSYTGKFLKDYLK